MIKVPEWNLDGWKTGLCSVKSLGHSSSLLAMSNHACVNVTLIRLKKRFDLLLKKRAHLHHYTEFMEYSEFFQAQESLSDLIQSYANVS
jgi:tubulin epsilon